MPVDPFTIECRAVAGRMAVCTNLSGNTVLLRKMTYEDSATIAQLRDLVAAMGGGGPPAGPGDAPSLTLAHVRLSNIHECEGNLMLHPLLIASAADVVAAVDFIEAIPA